MNRRIGRQPRIGGISGRKSRHLFCELSLGAHRGDATSSRASHEQAARSRASLRRNIRSTASAVLPRPIRAPRERNALFVSA